MPLSVTNVSDNPQQPMVSAEAYIPDQLIAGNLKLVTTNITLTGSAALKRGSVLGLITASGKYQLAASAASDGSQTPVAILVADADATGGDVTAAIYQMGEFNGAALTLGTGITLAAATAALAANNIYIKSAVSAADPS